MTTRPAPPSLHPAIYVLRVGDGTSANALSPAVADRLESDLDHMVGAGYRFAVLVGAEPKGRLGIHKEAAEPSDVFSSGFDFSDIDRQTVESVAERFTYLHALLRKVRSLPVVSFAYVGGPAAGAGADLAAACDYVYAGESARFRFPGYRFGIALGSDRLADLVGSRSALEWVLSGRWVDAREALEAGLIYRLCPWNEFVDHVNVLVEAATPLYGHDFQRALTLTRKPLSDDATEVLLSCFQETRLLERMAGYWLSKSSKAASTR